MKATKYCPTCGEEKPREEYYRNRSRYDGLTYQCKHCWDERARTARPPSARGRAIGARLPVAAERSREAHLADAARRVAPFLAAEPGRWGAPPFPAVERDGRICHGDAVLVG